MLSFDALTQIPCRFTVGEAISWTDTLSSYPSSGFSVAYKFAGNTPLDGPQQFSVSGTGGVNGAWAFALPTNAKPGVYSWERQITKTVGSIMRVESRGYIVAQPNYATTPTETQASRMVSTLSDCIEALSSNPDKTINLNGQSTTSRDLPEIQEQLVYWQARVVREQAALAALSGCGDGGLITPKFIPMTGGPTFGGDVFSQ